MKRQAGFTLLEVLIASTILFVVIAVASETYRNAAAASARAEAVVAMLTPLPLITTTVRDELRTDPQPEKEGSAQLLGVEYQWRAETVRYGAPPRRFDPDLTEFSEYAPRFRLYDVRLTLRFRGREREYLYQELAWEPMRR